MVEGHGDVAPLFGVGREDARPVEGEEFAQFWGKFDEVGGEAALSKEVDDGEEQERLMRCAMAGEIGPTGSAFVGVEVDEIVGMSF